MSERYQKIQDIDYYDLIRLTGITGVISINQFYKKNEGYISPDGDFVISFDNHIVKMRVLINFKEKTINVSKFQSRGKTDRVFLKILYSMQYFGTRLGFESIKIVAQGYYRHPANMIGYIVAGKYGFLMTIDNDEHYLKRTAIGIGLRDCDNIYSLLLNDLGFRTWTRYGREWVGTFSLLVGSTSKHLIEKSLLSRNLKGGEGVIT